MTFYIDLTAIYRLQTAPLSVTVEATDIEAAMRLIQAWASGILAVTSVVVRLDSISGHRTRGRTYVPYTEINLTEVLPL